MSTARSTSSKQSHTASNPCPVCGGHDGMARGQGVRCIGFISGDWIHCSREERATSGNRFHPGSQTYAHKLAGPCPCGQEHRPAEPKPGAKAGLGERVAQFDYRDLDGSIVLRVVKFTSGASKTFRQCRVVDGREVWDLKGVKPILYRRAELAKAGPDLTVFVVEGEKDADRLAKFGLVATTNPMGAGKWKDHYSEDLRGRDVVILPDNDKVGREHAEMVAQSLARKARSVKILALAGLPEKGDVSDWLDKGHSITDLKAIVEAAPLWTPYDPPVQTNDVPPTIPIRPPGTEQKPRGFNLTDLGNAERLIQRHGVNLRYCHPWKKWLTWDGKRWAVDNTAAARRWAKDTARNIYKEASVETDDDRRKAIVRHATDSEKRDRLAAMLNLAEAEEGCPILPEQMDCDPWSLNVANGTLDLKTGKLRPHRREDYITKLCKVVFDPAAKCPLWDQTLDLFFNHDRELIDYFQRICGYAICGEIQDHLLPICYGDGSNGKSTLLGTLLDVLGGDYAMKATNELLMAKKHATHSTDKTDLFGKRLVVAIETEDGRRLDEGLVKELTGGDKIRARRMREDNWEFSPTHTFMLATNHKPEIKGDDNGIWRRLRLVPFNVQVEDSDADKAMPQKLRTEYPGILAWCVRGCLEWQKKGLDEPAIVTQATKEYRAEQDSIGRFLEEFTIRSDNNRVRVKAGALYQPYVQWAEGANEKNILNQMAFGLAMKKRGIKKEASNGMWYVGIGLRAESDDRNTDFGTPGTPGTHLPHKTDTPRIQDELRGESVPSIPGVPNDDWTALPEDV